jgi:hypothetical protein
MKENLQPLVELQDVVAGLWVWRVEHPRWKPNQGWEPVVASTCVESGGQDAGSRRARPARLRGRPRAAL